MWRSVVQLVVLSLFSLAVPAFAGQVARAQFSSDVIDREPIDDIGNRVQVEYGEIQRVYFFTDLRGFTGHKISHLWKLDGVPQAEIAFDIGGDRWRVWSSKRLMPGFDGRWTVDIVSEEDVIASYWFDYVDE